MLLEQGRQQAENRQRQGELTNATWQNLAKIASQYGQQQEQARVEAPIRAQEAQMRGLQIQNAQAQQKELQDRQLGNQVLDEALKPVTPQGPAEGGGNLPTEHPYLGADGLYDTAKLQRAFAAQGVGHLAPEILKNVDALNESVTKHQAAVQKASESKTVLLGDLADTAAKMHKQGTPLDQALDFAAQSALTTGAINPAEYQKSRAQILAMPPEQQDAALTLLMDSAAKVGGGKTLAKDAVEYDRYGRTVATNVVPEKITTADLEAKAMAAYGRQNANTATPDDLNTISAWEKTHPHPPAPVRSLDEQLLEAITKGDKAGADRITQTLRTAAQAKQDPAALASLEATRALTREAAQARLDKLREEAKPLDISPQIQTTLLAGGMRYLDSSKYGKAELSKARKAAEDAGVPIVSKETADGLVAADRAATTLDGMWAQLKPYLPADASGRLIGGARNTLEKAFQSNPTLGAFGTWRTAAVQAVQALAEKGMGLRLNQAEIGNLLEGLPKITDDAPTAEQKMKNIGIQLQAKVKNALTQDRSTLGVSGGTIAPGSASPSSTGWKVLN